LIILIIVYINILIINNIICICDLHIWAYRYRSNPIIVLVKIKPLTGWLLGAVLVCFGLVYNIVYLHLRNILCFSSGSAGGVVVRCIRERHRVLRYYLKLYLRVRRDNHSI